jgi:murein DD-endopeptidase MepM/ murein hydrolase activator NlpD
VAQEPVAVAVAGHRPPTPPLFTWPVRGAIVSNYGTTPTGGHNDGINISAKEGTEVDAAEAGVVAYAGNGVPGFGNLLLIKHPGGWITAYGHNEELLVKVGDKVRRGQAIAKVGATGRVSGPQLHFEVRHEVDQEVKPLDPLDHLPAPGSDAG